MGNLGRVIAIGALLGACSRNPEGASEARSTAVPRAKAALDKPEHDPRFDAEGNLRTGSLKIGWFAIPMGFERVPGSTERSGIYEASGISQEQLRRYVDAQGQPKQVDSMAHGEIYKQVAAGHSKLPLPPVDVTVLVVDARARRLRLVVDDRTPTEPDLTPQQAMEKLAKARDRTE
ncbi:MAG: hypothetical protein ABW352_17275 [Polyangiales bacterium]